jgi:Uma2 family endonuclease
MREAVVADDLGDEDLYPSSDGKPMGETDYHALAWVFLLQALEDLTQDIEDVHVAGNLFIYYEEGNPKARKAPDGMVTFGVKRGLRRTFKTWVEKAVPNVAIELTSKRTKKEDVTVKPEVYERIGIKEYFLFDPEGAYLRPPLQGYRLKRGKYVALKTGPGGSLVSEELQARLLPEGYMLRFIDLRTGRPVLNRREQYIAAQEAAELVAEARRQSEQERQRADALAAELAQLKARMSKNGK